MRGPRRTPVRRNDEGYAKYRNAAIYPPRVDRTYYETVN